MAAPMSATRADLPVITSATGDDLSVAAMVEEMLWWQSMAINKLQAVGLIMSTVAADNVGSVNTARKQSRALLRRVLDDVEHTVDLLETGR
jgi:hypothetical protein